MWILGKHKGGVMKKTTKKAATKKPMPKAKPKGKY